MDWINKGKVVTFGEVMMRLSPPGHALIAQSDALEILYGGGEANVAIALSYLDVHASHVTCFPDTRVGRAAAQYLRKHLVDTSDIVYAHDHLGLYFLEKGAIHRPSEIVYQRAGSAFSRIEAETFDWKEILTDADWFHWTGITPAVSEGAARSLQAALSVCGELGIKVSADFHSRSSLWKYGIQPREIMPSLIQQTHVAITSVYDISRYVKNTFDPSSLNFTQAASLLMEEYQGLEIVADKTRTMVNASHNKLSGMVWDGVRLSQSQEYDLVPIVDRVGTGDAFAAGLIYGLRAFNDLEKSINFATAACALKHTVEGDANMVSYQQVFALMNGNTTARIVR